MSDLLICLTKNNIAQLNSRYFLSSALSPLIQMMSVVLYGVLVILSHNFLAPLLQFARAAVVWAVALRYCMYFIIHITRGPYRSNVIYSRGCRYSSDKEVVIKKRQPVTAYKKELTVQYLNKVFVNINLFDHSWHQLIRYFSHRIIQQTLLLSVVHFLQA